MITTSAPTIAAIQRAVAEHFGLSLDRMLCSRRLREFTRPRQLAMYLACELTHASMPQIGRSFDRDHTTVLHARRLVPELASKHAEIAKAIDDITQQLTNDSRQQILPFVA